MKLEQTECSETSAYKIQTPGNYPEESILVKTNLRIQTSQHWSDPSLFCRRTRFYALFG